MNKFLADLYGTAETVGASSSDDTEKLAEAKLLDDFFTSEGIDVDKLSDESIVKVAHQLFGDDSAIVKEAVETEEETAKEKEEKDTPEKEEDKETEEEKVAQADFLGRVMAHSFHQESGEIEKNAGPVGAALKGIGSAVKGKAQQIGRTYKGARGRMTDEGTWESAGRLKSLAETAKKHPKTIGAAGLAAAGAAGMGVGAARKGKKKESSALDALAEPRAIEMLKEAGYEIEEVESEEQKLASAVDQRALEMLSEAGYPVE